MSVAARRKWGVKGCARGGGERMNGGDESHDDYEVEEGTEIVVLETGDRWGSKGRGDEWVE